MQPRNTILFTLKFLGKLLLGLLLLFFILVGVIHLSPVQKRITRGISDYLSEKLSARVEIQSISFSISGKASIENLKIWDPEKQMIFSSGKIELSTNIFNLLSGDFLFNKLHISNVNWHLTQDERGLNIQFIIDAFKSKEDKVSTPNEVRFHVNTIQLENVVFEYFSITNGTTVHVNLERFTSREAEYSSKINKIDADSIYLQHAVVSVSTRQLPDTAKNSIVNAVSASSHPESGKELVYEIRGIEISNSDFSFNRDSKKNTSKFDPDHIEVQHIKGKLSNILVSNDTLSVALQALSARLPGFSLSDAGAKVYMNSNRLSVSEMHLASGNNEFRADMTGWYDTLSGREADDINFILRADSRISPSDLAYFFNDSILDYFKHWEIAELDFDGKYIHGRGEIKNLNLRTRDSQLQASGIVNEALDYEKLNWKELLVTATVGSDFKKSLSPFTRDINVPEELELRLKSSGTSHRIFVDTDILSAWGNLKAKGWTTVQPKSNGFDLNLTGENIDLGKWLTVSWLGPVSLTSSVNGIIGKDQNIEINGFIEDIEILDRQIQGIAFQSQTLKDSATLNVSIGDLKYCAEISSEISFSDSIRIESDIRLDGFMPGYLLNSDTALSISGDLKTIILLDKTSLEAVIDGDSILFRNNKTTYLLDSMTLHALVSPEGSSISYYSDEENIDLVSNFDLRDSPKVFRTWSENFLKVNNQSILSSDDHSVKFNAEMENASMFQMLGMDVSEFSSLRVEGEFHERGQSSVLQVATGKFNGYGVSMDTIQADLFAMHDSLNAVITIKNLQSNSLQLGDINFNFLTKGDTATSDLRLVKDSADILSLSTRILRTDTGMFIYPDRLQAFDQDYIVDTENPLFLGKNRVQFRHFQITGDDMQINLDGDLNAFDVSLRNVDLMPLNFLLDSDTTIVNGGHLSGHLSYLRNQQIDLKAEIEGLRLYNSQPLRIDATALSNGNQVPFEFLLTNAANSIELKGLYYFDNSKIDAALMMEIDNLEIFDFLVSDIIDEMNGGLNGEVMINGTIQKPAFNGTLQFQDVNVTTVNPRLHFNVREDKVFLDGSSLRFDNFTLYDHNDKPLTVNGTLNSLDYKQYSYDLKFKADHYTLFSKPDSAGGRMYGVLVIDSDVKLKGNEKDTYIEADINIKDTTNLTFVTSSDEIELLKTEGIIDFVDPSLFLDTTTQVSSESYYDSLLASLPAFNLTSTVSIEENAILRLIIDAQSGDFIEASGGAKLELGYDRTGNLRLSGNYTITKGLYRLSFYDLVKKDFTLVKGSAITWSGSPENGSLSIKAVHTVESNSIGLIGHEIGESEKSVYKRSLDYEVGININGTIESPVVSFSLDLPEKEKTSYPVLANKLDRLRQPEYAAELNKQVFGLLVLGGFLPEESGSDINSNLVATTALSNSVNSLLASQLNRFASQYVKGVNIDVGIQSYSDYSDPAGKTQTAMDFRVSKSLMNDRLSFEVGGDFDINQSQSGANTGNKNYRGDVAIIYDLTGNGDKQLKLFNNETYDIIYQEIRNTGVSLIFIREFDAKEKRKDKEE